MFWWRINCWKWASQWVDVVVAATVFIHSCVVAVTNNSSSSSSYSSSHSHLIVNVLRHLFCCGSVFISFFFVLLLRFSLSFAHIFTVCSSHFECSSINRRPLSSSHKSMYVRMSVCMCVRPCVRVCACVFACLYFAWLKLDDALLNDDRTRDRTIFIVFRLDITYQFILFVLSRLTMCALLFVPLSFFFFSFRLFSIAIAMLCVPFVWFFAAATAVSVCCCCHCKLLIISVYRWLVPFFLLLLVCLNSQIEMN